MIVISQKETTIDGEIWKGSNLAGSDDGLTVMKVFLSHHFHSDWELTITDSKWRTSQKVNVSIEDMAEAVADTYKEVGATRITEVKENSKFQTYTVFMMYGDEYLKKEIKTEEEKEAEFLDSIVEAEYIGSSFSKLVESEG